MTSMQDLGESLRYAPGVRIWPYKNDYSYISNLNPFAQDGFAVIVVGSLCRPKTIYLRLHEATNERTMKLNSQNNP